MHDQHETEHETEHEPPQLLCTVASSSTPDSEIAGVKKCESLEKLVCGFPDRARINFSRAETV